MPAQPRLSNAGVAMSYAERAHSWNEWYDGLPDRWRFQVVLWPLLLIGTVNMMLTIGNGFPFGLLVVLAILCLAAVRVPYKAGWMVADPSEPDTSEHPERTVHLGRIDWAWALNRRYDAMPEWRRFWVFPAVLVIAGGINMALTLADGFPFALLFLLALLVMVAMRAPYVWGWLTPPPDREAAAPSLRVAHDTTPPVAAFSPIGAAPAGQPEPAEYPQPAEYRAPTIGHDEPPSRTETPIRPPGDGPSP